MEEYENENENAEDSIRGNREFHSNDRQCNCTHRSKHSSLIMKIDSGTHARRRERWRFSLPSPQSFDETILYNNATIVNRTEWRGVKFSGRLRVKIDEIGHSMMDRH
jgi:hypothetical protein